MNFSQRDFKDLSDLGQALWVDARQSERAALDSVAVLTLSPGAKFPELPPDVSGDQLVERISETLLRRASTEGAGAVAPRIQEPFFRLPPEERLALMALHRGRWAYAQLARVLHLTPEGLQEFVWGARMHLALGTSSSARVRNAPGSLKLGQDCPDFNPARPWTQRFLDEELAPREKLFIQSHASRCDACRQALVHARHLYYAVDAVVPRGDEAREKSLARALKSLRLPRKGYMTFGETLAVFTRRPDVRVALAALAVLLVSWVLR